MLPPTGGGTDSNGSGDIVEIVENVSAGQLTVDADGGVTLTG
jgi:hypothetical protein